MKTDAEYRQIKSRAAKAWLELPGVNAVGLGGKRRDGRPTGEIAIKVFVSKKRPASDLPADQQIPSEFEGVPTDVMEAGAFRRLEVPGAPRDAEPEHDTSRYRPMVGGCQIQGDFPGSGRGTLGCILRDLDDPTIAYALTALHVLQESETVRPELTAAMRIGQPEPKESMSRCCRSSFGNYHAPLQALVTGDTPTFTRDAAIVRLESGTEWMAEILEIGPIRGTYSVTLADIAGVDYPVRKRGKTTQLTGGVIEALDIEIDEETLPNSILISPNEPPGASGGLRLDPSRFADGGDSGSALVNEWDEVVGLVIGDLSAVAAGDPLSALAELIANSRAVAIDIGAILEEFRTDTGVNADVAEASTAGVVHSVGSPATRMLSDTARPRPPSPTTPARARARPSNGDWQGISLPADFPSGLERLQDDFDRTARGRQIVQLWLSHQEELNRLINENRRVAVVWHRNHGPALVQSLLRFASVPGHRLPTHLGDRPLWDALDAIDEALQHHGSDTLAAAMKEFRQLLPEVEDRTYDEIQVALLAAPDAVRATDTEPSAP